MSMHTECGSHSENCSNFLHFTLFYDNYQLYMYIRIYISYLESFFVENFNGAIIGAVADYVHGQWILINWINCKDLRTDILT